MRASWPRSVAVATSRWVLYERGLLRGRPVSRRRTLPPRRPDCPRDATGPERQACSLCPVSRYPRARSPASQLEESHGQRTEVLHQRCMGRAQHHRHARRHQPGDRKADRVDRHGWCCRRRCSRHCCQGCLRDVLAVFGRRANCPPRQDHRTDRRQVRGVRQHNLIGDGRTRRPRQGRPGPDRPHALRHRCADPA